MSTTIGTPPSTPTAGIIAKFVGNYQNATSTPTSILSVAATTGSANVGYRIKVYGNSADVDKLTIRLTAGGATTDISLLTTAGSNIYYIDLFNSANVNFAYSMRTQLAATATFLSGSNSLAASKTWTQLTNIEILGDNNASASTLSVYTAYIEQIPSVI